MLLRGLLALAVVAVFFLCGCTGGAVREPQKAMASGEAQVASVPEPGHPPALLAVSELPAEAALDLRVLRTAYPGAVLGMERSATGGLLLVMEGNRRLVYDDGRTRTQREALDDPDLRTMLAQVYPAGPVTEAMAHPAPGFDPGRSRVEAFFTALYGGTEPEVRASCVNRPFLKRKPLFTTRHGAAAALERVGARIAALQHTHPEYRRILWPLGGSLVWRVIAGTGRLSMHSFGISLDLNPSLAYWRTDPHPETVPSRVRHFPPDILAAFEAEGFIWGGKWAAFDLMHFEYRPELILKARALAGQPVLK